MAAASNRLDQAWKERLGIENRQPPELYESADEVVDAAHAPAIRAALDDIGLSAVFCVQGVPTIGIVTTEQYDRKQIARIHGVLWNQGLASLLLVISNDTLRAFSIGRKPYRESGKAFEKRFLIDTLRTTAEALRLRNLIYGAESGRLWRDYAAYFRPKERIDHVLLGNLKQSHKLLCNVGLPTEAAQALLIQAMFIAYLEDRKIITADYFKALSRDSVDCFSSLLTAKKVTLLKSLFSRLRNDFNGDLFVAPCSFEARNKAPKIIAEHLDVLARFRDGREEMEEGGQGRFWGYDFRFIPIELVSTVYDRFLGEKEDRREHGAYYTPMFLADTVVSQAWELLPDQIKEHGSYLDPACGSGVFLVRSFQRLCEHWRSTRKSQTIRWNSLLRILQRVHGWDVNPGAVRVAVFSLYVALLEEVSPPDIRRLTDGGKILPDLWDKTLTCTDFFGVSPNDAKFDAIIGNPPWTSRRGSNRSSVRWCKENLVPMPGGEDAWAFAWKAAKHLTENGMVAFLLPAMGFLHNHAANTIDARNRFIRENRIERIINFADLRFQLFEHAHRPAALILFGNKTASQTSYRFDYWAPKADLNLQIKRLITLSSADKLSLNSTTIADNPLAFKQRLWMREPDGKLFAYLSRLPRIGDLVVDFGSIRRRKQQATGRWVIGQGFQPFNSALERRPSSYSMSRHVGELPDLPIDAFGKLAQPTSGLMPWPSHRVRRKGFEAGFYGPRILVPRGVETSQTRLRAAYCDEPLTFRHIIQAIVVPQGQERKGKLLTAFLNSRVAIWFAFHGTASYAADRPEVQQAELLRLPFPNPSDLPEPRKAQAAATKLVKIVEEALQTAKGAFGLHQGDAIALERIDELAYEYFGLSDNEILLIEDAVEKIIPSVQPHVGNFPSLWRPPTEEERSNYATTLVKSLKKWFRDDGNIVSRLEACSADIGILSVSLNGDNTPYAENKDSSFADVLARISRHIHQPLSGNFQLLPDLRVFAGQTLYLIKPLQLRFWLRASALADADTIAMDLQDAVVTDRRRGHG